MSRGLEALTAFIAEIAQERPADRERAEQRLRFLAKGALYDALRDLDGDGDLIEASRAAQAVAGAAFAAALLLGRN